MGLLVPLLLWLRRVREVLRHLLERLDRVTTEDLLRGRARLVRLFLQALQERLVTLVPDDPPLGDVQVPRMLIDGSAQRDPSFASLLEFQRYPLRFRLQILDLCPRRIALTFPFA